MAISTRMSRSPGHALGPFSLHGSAPLQLETEFGEELDGGIEVFHHDADVVHAFDRHDVSLASNCHTPHASSPRTPEHAARRRWVADPEPRTRHPKRTRVPRSAAVERDRRP